MEHSLLTRPVWRSAVRWRDSSGLLGFLSFTSPQLGRLISSDTEKETGSFFELARARPSNRHQWAKVSKLRRAVPHPFGKPHPLENRYHSFLCAVRYRKCATIQVKVLTCAHTRIRLLISLSNSFGGLAQDQPAIPSQP